MSGTLRLRWGVNDEVKRVPAHVSPMCELPWGMADCTNSEWARHLRSSARYFGEWPHIRVGVWSLRQIAKNMGTTPTRVRELLRARKAT